MAWHCDACGAQLQIRRARRPLVVRVTEPGGHETRVVTVRGALVHQCRLDALVARQLVFALA